MRTADRPVTELRVVDRRHRGPGEHVGAQGPELFVVQQIGRRDPERPCRCDVAAVPCDQPRAGERPGACAGAELVGVVEHCAKPTVGFREAALPVPERTVRGDEQTRGLPLAEVDRRVVGAAELGEQGRQIVGPGARQLTPAPGVDPVDDPGDGQRVTSSDVGGLLALGEQFDRASSEQLEHAEPSLTVGSRPGPHEALVDESRQRGAMRSGWFVPDRQGVEHVDLFAVQPQPLPAGREHREAGDVSCERADRRCGRDDVLDVVGDHEGGSVAHVLADRSRRVRARGVQPERSRNVVDHEIGVPDRRQVDEDDVPIAHAAGVFDGDAGLADAARPDDRHDARLAEEVGEPGRVRPWSRSAGTTVREFARPR